MSSNFGDWLSERLQAGEVVAVPDGPCAGADLTVDWTSKCTAATKTMEVALEAHYAMNGSYPVDVDELVEAGFLR